MCLKLQDSSEVAKFSPSEMIPVEIVPWQTCRPPVILQLALWHGPASSLRSNWTGSGCSGWMLLRCHRMQPRSQC